MENVEAKIVEEGLDLFFTNSNCEAKVSLVFGVFMKNLGSGRFRYFYAQERKQHPPRRIKTFVHQRQYGKA